MQLYKLRGGGIRVNRYKLPLIARLKCCKKMGRGCVYFRLSKGAYAPSVMVHAPGMSCNSDGKQNTSENVYIYIYVYYFIMSNGRYLSKGQLHKESLI